VDERYYVKYQAQVSGITYIKIDVDKDGIFDRILGNSSGEMSSSRVFRSAEEIGPG
jgi:hypothetical protein